MVVEVRIDKEAFEELAFFKQALTILTLSL